MERNDDRVAPQRASSVTMPFFPIAPMTVARDAFNEGVRILLPALVGIVPFGFIVGVAGTPVGPWETLGLSILAFSGVMQLVVYQLLAGASLVPVVLLAVAMISLRFL
jgi:predicted branched-subunit amino acid permease